MFTRIKYVLYMMLFWFSLSCCAEDTEKYYVFFLKQSESEQAKPALYESMKYWYGLDFCLSVSGFIKETNNWYDLSTQDQYQVAESYLSTNTEWHAYVWGNQRAYSKQEIAYWISCYSKQSLEVTGKVFTDVNFSNVLSRIQPYAPSFNGFICFNPKNDIATNGFVKQ